MPGATGDGGGEFLEAARLIVQSGGNVVAFTGAGISVESGIPDFRSEGGLWTRYDPDIYCHIDTFDKEPSKFWTMAAEMATMTSSAKPNPAHEALVELEQLGLLHTVITQNVDGLHQVAGSSKVYELHGTSTTSTCRMCKERVKTEGLLEEMGRVHSEMQVRPDWPVPCHIGFQFLSELMVALQVLQVPSCNICEGVMKMDVVLFGEALPQNEIRSAMEAASSAKLVIVVGTSITVQPAALIPTLCRQSGGSLIVCNKDDSGQEMADVFLQGNAGEVLPRLLAEVKRQQTSASL